MSTNEHWQSRPEGGGHFAIWLIRTIALYGGRRLGRLCLYPITLYFYLRRHARASRRGLCGVRAVRACRIRQPHPVADLRDQIGRESCRERVCPDGMISVVGVS